MSSGVEQQFSSSKDINDLDANVNNITFAERGVYNSGNVRSINTGDNARNIDARVYIEQYYTSSPPSIISILQNYAKALLTNYQLYWQQYVVLTSNEDNLANIPKPVGQIFDCPALEHELAKLRSVSQPSHTANPPRTEQLEDVEQHHNYGRVDDSSQNNQDKKVLLSEFTTLQDVVAKLRVYGMFAAGAVLIGEPGAGKTLSMRYFAVQQAQRAADSNEAIPIYLPLNAYRGETSLFDFVVHVFSADSTDPVFQQFADRLKEIASIRPLLLLLDGFNEIGDFSQGSDEQRKQFENILSDCLKYEPHVNFILSSREFVVPILPTAQGSIVVNLRPLDQFRISDYLRLYAPEYYIAILEELSTNASLQQLAANPFRAKALAYIYHPNRQLPSTPGTLFEQLVEQMIAREATKYHFQEVSWPLSVNWKNSIAKLAFNLQSNHKTAIDIKDPIINNVDSSDLQIAAICGVLQPVTHVVQFVHQQLQEYFAAQWLIQNNYQATSILNLPSNVLYDSYWDQTLLMLSNLISSEKLDGLVIQIACIDPFLAARCVGQSPGKVTLQVRVWLAAYFVRSLNEPTLSLSEMFEQILRALAEMNCSESFSQLASKDLLDQVCTRSKETINVYIDAVANFDHEAAAHFIIEEIYPAIVDKLSRYDTNPIVSALARMKTPYARNFLAVSLQDRKLYIDVLKAIGDYRIQGMDEQIREILESGNHLDEVLPAISKANLINLVSDLLPFAHENLAIMTVLIELGVGQVAIADYTKLQITLNRFYYNQRDYSEMGLDDYHNFQRAIKTFIAVEHTLGQTSAHQFTDLILYIAQNHQDYRTLHFALSVLVYLRHPTLQAVLERVERYLEEQLAPRSSQDNSFLVTPSSLHTFISFARRYLEFSGAPGFSQQRLERFCFALNSYSKQLINESIPQSISELVKLVYLEPQKIGHYAVLLLQSLNLHSNNYLERDARTYVVCLELLSDLNYTQIGNLIISGITQFLQRMRPREYGHNFRREIWRLAHVAVEYGQQNGRQRKEILDTVTSWLFVSNTLQQQVAVEICGRLNAYEYSAKWPLYLNDRTWITAYCIVDLLGRITVPEDVVQLLIKQLNLQQEDRRFFAALALGEIKAIDYIDDLVAIYSTSNQHVQWAIIWALGNIGKLTPSVIKLLHKAARSTFGRVRIEVANASAKLSAQELGSTLMALLDDSDLRVVERTVYALGCIRERAAIDQLLRLISQISSGRSHLSMFSAPYHVIERLERVMHFPNLDGLSILNG